MQENPRTDITAPLPGSGSTKFQGKYDKRSHLMNRVTIFVLFLMFAIIRLHAGISENEGIIASFGGVNCTTEENNIEFYRKLGFDSAHLKNWNTYDKVLTPDELNTFRQRFQLYKEQKLGISGVIETIEREGKKNGEYFKKHPDRYQWLYTWLEINSDGLSASAKLPANADKSKGLQYWKVKDVTGLQNPGIDFDVLKKNREVPASDWHLEEDTIYIRSQPGRKYIAFIPCKYDIVSLLPLESQKYVCENLDKYLAQFQDCQYSYFWAEAVASMGNYCGSTTWPDCSPPMQELFKQKTGLDFDPELVQLDPLYWEKWTRFKADVVAESIKMIFDIYHKYKIKGSYYIGDCTFGGSCESLGKSGLDYIWVNQGGSEHYWISTFWGNWENKPAYGQSAWPRNFSLSEYASSRRQKFFRGVTNQTIPDALFWGLTSSMGCPDAAIVKYIHDNNWRYKFVYKLLKKYKQDFIATGYIPTLGTSYYMPALTSLFTKEGYLWDTPIKWKHMSLTDLAKGKIPEDCDLLLIPSEPFMSGMIDNIAAAQIKKWVEAGHALLVLRAASSLDIYGKSRGYAPLREITGIDYNQAKSSSSSKNYIRTAENWITEGMPNDISVKIVSGRYPLNASAQYFKGGKQAALFSLLLPSWAACPPDRAVISQDNVNVLYKSGQSPLTAIRELGKGRVAYVAQEYNLGKEFGHKLFRKIAYWLCNSEKNFPIETDNYNVETALYYNDNEILMTIFNPTDTKQKAIIFPVSPQIDNNQDYAIMSINIENPADSEVLLTGKKMTWKGSDLKKNGHQLEIEPDELKILKISRANKQPIFSEHCFLDTEKNISAFSSHKIIFAEYQERKEEGNMHQIDLLDLKIELQDQPPYKLTLAYKKKGKASAIKEAPQVLDFGPETIKIHVSEKQAVVLRYEENSAVEFINGEIFTYLPMWKASYNKDKQELLIQIGE